MGAFEDAGVLLELMQFYCLDSKRSRLSFDSLETVAQLYEKIRVPRALSVYRASHSLGGMQRSRAARPSMLRTAMQEWSLWLRVQRYGTLPELLAANGFDFKEAVHKELAKREAAKFIDTMRSKL
jgi:hypothetical protein